MREIDGFRGSSKAPEALLIVSGIATLAVLVWAWANLTRHPVNDSERTENILRDQVVRVTTLSRKGITFKIMCFWKPLLSRRNWVYVLSLLVPLAI